jgi:hypothetical protein
MSRKRARPSAQECFDALQGHAEADVQLAAGIYAWAAAYVGTMDACGEGEPNQSAINLAATVARMGPTAAEEAGAAFAAELRRVAQPAVEEAFRAGMVGPFG